MLVLLKAIDNDESVLDKRFIVEVILLIWAWLASWKYNIIFSKSIVSGLERLCTTFALNYI